MDKKKISRKRPIKVELEPVAASSTSNLKDEEIELPRNCSSSYFKNENFRLSFENEMFDVKSNDIKSEYSVTEQLAAFVNPKKIKWEPPNWEEQYEFIRQMRGNKDAPVDNMGCDAIASIDATLTPKEKRYQVLVSLMLSSQTKDEVTAKAMSELQKLPLNIENFLAEPDEQLQKMIYPCSFYKRKVIYIKKTSQILKEKYDNDIPNSVEELQKLPGVGPKMAYLTMSCAWNDTVGIGVDTHVHRISNRLGWTRTQTKLPEKTRKELEDWLPQTHWSEVNHLLVGFGQTVCRPIGPHCSDCLCKDICPTGIKVISDLAIKSKSKKAKKSDDQI